MRAAWWNHAPGSVSEDAGHDASRSVAGPSGRCRTHAQNVREARHGRYRLRQEPGFCSSVSTLATRVFHLTAACRFTRNCSNVSALFPASAPRASPMSRPSVEVPRTRSSMSKWYVPKSRKDMVVWNNPDQCWVLRRAWRRHSSPAAISISTTLLHAPLVAVINESMAEQVLRQPVERSRQDVSERMERDQRSHSDHRRRQRHEVQ